MAQKSRLSIHQVPREVRLMFWGHLLKIGSIHVDTDLTSVGIVPRWPDEGMNTPVKRLDALFRLSKKFVEEIEYTFYSCNTYVLTSETSIERFVKILQMNGKDRRPLLKHIQTGLGYHDICHTKDACIKWQAHQAMFDADTLLNADGTEIEDQQAYDFWSHRIRKNRFQEFSWRRKLGLVVAELNPRHLTLDLRQAYCEPIGCCSMEATAIMQLKHMRFDRGVPELHVLGLRGFSDSLPSTIGDTLVRSLWKSWTETGWEDVAESEAERMLSEEMEQEMMNNGRWALPS